MPILSSDINSKVRYYSGANFDKVVKVFTGQYSSGDLTTRVGTIDTIYQYVIPHGLTRPLQCELIYSTDGGTTWVDGGTSKLVYSDSTNIYIFHGTTTGGTPVDYKVYCTWIDDYDGSNPTVDVSNYSDNVIQYDSRLNYPKIYEQGILTFTGGTFGATETQTIVHDIGIAPNAKVYFTAFSNQVWPCNSGGATNVFSFDFAQDECEFSTYSNRLDVTVFKFSGSTINVYYRIYYDSDQA